MNRRTNNALKGSNIDYIPYVAPVDEETNEDQPAEEPAAPAAVVIGMRRKDSDK